MGYVEREAFCQAVLLARMEDEGLDRAPLFPSLERFPSDAFRGAVDLVVAGFPCPPYSSAGLRRGMEDERDLWPSVLDVVRRVGPAHVFLENVAGAVRHPDGLPRWLGDLAALGFDAEWDVLGADEVGGPFKQGDRLFVLASRDRLGLPDAAVDTDQEVWRAVTGGGPVMGATDGRRRQGRRLPERSRIEREPWPLALGHGLDWRLHWPPRKSCPSWDQWGGAGGPLPVLRRGSDGLPAFVDRADRIAALGNAVIPLQARVAFESLFARCAP